MKKNIFLLLAIVGAVLPYAVLISWVMQHGFDIPLLFDNIVNNKISLFGWVDVVISALVLFVLIISDTVLPSGKKIMAMLATCLVGVSCGLPLYLYFKEFHR